MKVVDLQLGIWRGGGTKVLGREGESGLTTITPARRAHLASCAGVRESNWLR